ncbi:type II toxin-antitoxin system death-on-curing family toxin [Propionicicella superfundia]|uniref:type II toxin-antitoxin system death-on-curing family toxin n=1 Tax=Propionicicella superfundia TaxID=348582 RepID=UPI00040A9EE3|nr:type II toxin-antitoxin system death-on-curing family toxin [Propionicicella superfundia]
MTEHLTLEDVLALIEDLGVGPIRDIGLLDSALHRPQVTVFGQDAYPTLDDKAAVLLESLVRNHALIDGNKRLGWLATVVFYGLNDTSLDAPDDDAYDLVIAIAGSTTAYQEAALLLAKWHEPPTAQSRPTGP